MSSHNDTAMTRFLFAILRQKNLKDIDWNQVAQDPILSQPITNGHAARMRYSRFRSSMLGLEPTRRNRPSNKNRVTKSTKKEPGSPRPTIKEDSVNPEPSSHAQQQKESIRVKRESSSSQYGGAGGFDNRFTPGFTPGFSPAPNTTMGAPPTAAPIQFIHPRLLTPCSDTADNFASPSAMSTASPSADHLMHSQNTFDMFTNPPPCHNHDEMAWQNVGGFHSAFDAAYPPFDFNNTAASCHHHMHGRQQNFMDLPLNQSIEVDDDDLSPQPDVKKET